MLAVDFCAVIIAGGYSTRMGEDKAQMRIRTHSMLERAILCMQGVFGVSEIVLSCREDSPCVVDFIEYTSKMHSSAIQYGIVYDTYRDIGPLGGIYATLDYAQKECLYMPIDLPLLRPTYMEYLLNQYAIHKSSTSELLMLCYSSSAFIEPLVSIFSPKALPHIHKAIVQEEYSVVHSIPQRLRATIAYPTMAEIEHAFYNMNTKEDKEYIHTILARNKS